MSSERLIIFSQPDRILLNMEAETNSMQSYIPSEAEERTRTSFNLARLLSIVPPSWGKGAEHDDDVSFCFHAFHGLSHTFKLLDTKHVTNKSPLFLGRRMSIVRSRQYVSGRKSELG